MSLVVKVFDGLSERVPASSFEVFPLNNTLGLSVFVVKVLHGAERGETTVLILSPLKSTFKDKSGSDLAKNGSQFTFFLIAPLQAFCQMFGCVSSNYNEDAYSDADGIISTAFSEWEVILCTSSSLDITWAQVLSDPFLRRIILRMERMIILP